MRHRPCLWILCAAAALLGGCASGLDVQPARSAPGVSVAADRLFRPGPGQRIYADGAGRRTERRASALGDDGRWTLVTRIDGRAVDGTHVLERLADGSVALVSMRGARFDARETAQIVRFDPPLVLLPPELAWDQPFTADAALTTEPIGGGRVRDGRAEVETTVAGMDELERAMIRTRLRFFIGPARVTRETMRTVAEAGGIAGEHTLLTVRVFGLTIHRAEERFTLVE